jgi:hypothetical protein
MDHRERSGPAVVAAVAAGAWAWWCRRVLRHPGNPCAERSVALGVRSIADIADGKRGDNAGKRRNDLMRSRREGCTFLRRSFLVALSSLVLCGFARLAAATSSLSFDGGGYSIDLEIGDDAAPAVAAVHFHAPGDAQGVVLARETWRVITFEPRRQRLLLQHDGAAAVPAFSLSVQRDEAVLVIDGRHLRASFDWNH